MSKVIEDAAQDFAEINDDKAANSAHSYSKYDIADAYQQGADFGYCLAENRIKKEYEEKLRWIPVEEKLPEINKYGFTEELSTKNEYGITNQKGYKNAKGKFTWCDTSNVTHWRSFL